MKLVTKFFVVFVALLSYASTTAQVLTVEEIMKEPSIAGSRIEGTRLSPDGKWVLYLWNAEGKPARDLYIVSTETGESKKLLSPSDLVNKAAPEPKPDANEYGVVVNDEFARAQRNSLGNLRWSPDSSKFLFTQNGDIYLLKLGETKPRRLTKTETGEFAADFLDNDRLIFQQSGNIIALNTKDATLIQLSSEANPQKNISVFGANKSKDGKMIAYMVTDGSEQRSLFIPNYLPYFTTAPTIRRGWTRNSIFVNSTDGSLENPIFVVLPKQEGEAYIAGTEWLADESTLLIDRVDQTHKRRQIFAATFMDGKSSVYLVFEEKDDKWIGGPARILEANPSNPNEFIFSAESDRWNHIYHGKLDPTKFGNEKANAQITQLTTGNFEIDWAAWSSPNQVVYSSTEKGAAERQVFRLNTNTRAIEQITNMSGMKGGFQVSDPTSAAVKYIFGGSTWNTPEELFSDQICVTNCNKPPVRQLTQTTSKEFLARKWNAPKFVEIPSRDGKKIPARFYLPANVLKGQKLPLAIFVHGAGYLQNVINGWNNYYREFMFNQMLTQRGYAVLDIDYRGSAGYGRDWRTDVYDFLGGKDFDDHLDAIDWMVKTQNVDQKRIGVYGGSYGGFMAAMLAMRAPERVKASAALRPVMDWRNYYSTNPFYTSQRLGDPKSNLKAYKQSSPIAYADKLQSKLLILHGLLDDNVQAQDSIQLVEQLMRLGKTDHFELMLYPAERHGFERPSSWTDEYKRIDQLFMKELGK